MRKKNSSLHFRTTLDIEPDGLLTFSVAVSSEADIAGSILTPDISHCQLWQGSARTAVV